MKLIYDLWRKKKHKNQNATRECNISCSFYWVWLLFIYYSNKFIQGLRVKIVLEAIHYREQIFK